MAVTRFLSIYPQKGMCVPGEGIVFPSRTWHATPLNRNKNGMKRVVLFGAIGPSIGAYAKELNSKTLNLVLFPHTMARHLEEPKPQKVAKGSGARLNADQIKEWLEGKGFDMSKSCFVFFNRNVCRNHRGSLCKGLRIHLAASPRSEKCVHSHSKEFA